MDGARVIHWNVQPGERFANGEVLLEVETDKSVIEIPASEDGLLVEQLVGADDQVSFDAPIARIAVAGEPGQESAAASRTVPIIEEASSAETKRSPAAPASTAPPPAAATDTGTERGERKFATPVARKIAREQALDLADVPGTGPHGRVTRSDVTAVLDRRAVVPTVTSSHGAASSRVLEEQVAGAHGELYARTWVPADARAAPTLVLIHGMFGDADVWAGTASATVRAGLRTVAMDLPCHGRSRSAAVRFDTVVDEVATVVARLCRGPVALIGHSFGAAVAARVARKPDLDITSLILLAPVGLGSQIEQSFLDGMVNARSIPALERELGKLTVAGTLPSSVYLQTLRERLEAQNDGLAALCHEVALNGVQQLGITSDLGALSCPTVLIHGRGDAIVPWAHALSAPARVALHLLPEVGHMPQWEAPALTSEIITRAAGRLPS